MYLHRATYQRVGEIAGQNDLPDSYFWEYLQDTYAATQAVAVRRQAETSSRVRSLGRLLFEVSEDARRFTRSLFVEEIWDDAGDWMADKTFDEHFAGDIGDHLDPAIPRTDLDALTSTARALKTFVDEHVAHSDAKPAHGLPTFDDLNAAIDQIGHLLRKYTLLLTAAGLIELVPVIQHDWEAVFRQRWIRT